MNRADPLIEIMASTLEESSPKEVTNRVTGAKNSSTSPHSTMEVTTIADAAGDLSPFHYFLNEQAKSVMALQELQNEVGTLLEFRDLVIEVFPQLGLKLSQFSHPLHLQSALSPSKWEPGIRVKRKLGQQLRDPDFLEQSLLSRYRSINHGKGSRSNEVSPPATGSAIQDSGFCTDSNKDHLSAISNCSKSRETEDELFSFLDHIQRKGIKLKLELEYLWSRLQRENSSAFEATNKRRCKSLDDLMTSPKKSSFSESSSKITFLEAERSGLKKEHKLLLKKVRDIDMENMTNLIQTNRPLLELDTISTEKRKLAERLQNVSPQDTEVLLNFWTRNKRQGPQTPLAKGQPMSLTQLFKDTHMSDDTTVYLNSRTLSSSTLFTSEAENSRPKNPVTNKLNKNNNECISSIANLAISKKFAKSDILTGFSSVYLPSIQLVYGRGITLSNEKVLSILNECDLATLHRFLLTLSYQIQALNAYTQRISQSRLNVFYQMNKFKAENDDLKFQLEEKNIQLEGTKAKVRVLERLCNNTLSHSTSDLVEVLSRNNSRPSCPDSDITEMKKNSPNGLDPRDVNTRKSSLCKKVVSKIPLKTPPSKLPIRAHCSVDKSFTSFKKYPALGLSNISCISYMSKLIDK